MDNNIVYIIIIIIITYAGKGWDLHHGLFQNNVVLVICIGGCFPACGYNDDIENV